MRYPFDHDAARMAKRGGRSRADLPIGSPLWDLSAAEALAWLEGHGEADRESALGVSRATCCRRLRELREYASRHTDSKLWWRASGRH